MKTLTLSLATLALLTTAGRLAAEESTLRRSADSPLGTFRVEHHVNPEGDEHSVWLVSKKDAGTRHRLFVPSEGRTYTEVCYAPDILISPNEAWIARTQTRGSTCIVTRLHRRKSPLRYEQVVKLEPRAWAYAASQLGLAPDLVPPFHRAVEAVRWLDSTSILLVLRGDSFPGFRDPKGLNLRDWHCVYNVANGEFSIPKEFAKSNAEALTR